MPKRVFWPASLVTMGLIFLASNLGFLPREFWNLWPLLLIIVGLGGLLLSDRDEWLSEPSKAKKKVARRKTATAKSQTKSKAKTKKKR